MVAVASKIKRKRKIVLGPKDHGRRMTLDDFTNATTTDERKYELNKGVIEVAEIPTIAHALTTAFIRDLFIGYRITHPEKIYLVGGASEAKVMSQLDQSERHPDVLVYFAPPLTDDPQPWSEWVPNVVVEVVSQSSAKRDYEDKPSEYAHIGITEYWIVDRFKQTVTINMRWRATWKPRVLKPGQTYEPKLLPGFKLDVRKILAAGK